MQSTVSDIKLFMSLNIPQKKCIFNLVGGACEGTGQGNCAMATAVCSSGICVLPCKCNHVYMFALEIIDGMMMNLPYTLKLILKFYLLKTVPVVMATKTTAASD